MVHGDLFSGIGGFSLGGEMAGWETAFHCEVNPWSHRVLGYHFPKSTIYADITKTDFTIWRGRIDVLTGGFPCQPFSAAGKRKGTADERHLWPEMLRAIREISPRWIVGENVRGLVNWDGGLVFEQVQADLEAEGYEVLPFLLPACAVNAPHRRDRVWFIAYAEGLKDHGDRQGRFYPESAGANEQGATTDARHPEPQGREQAEKGQQHDGGRKARCESASFSGTLSTPNSTSNGRREDHGKGEPRQSNQTSEAANWQDFPTQSPICGGDDGLPTELDGIAFSKWRNESIKAYGNAIVPQVFYQIAQAINEYENTNPQNRSMLRSCTNP